MDTAGLERIVSESKREAESVLEEIKNHSEKYKKNRKKNAKNLVIAGLIGASIFASYRTIPYAAKKAIDFITEKAGSVADYLSEHPIYSIPGPEWLNKESPTSAEQTQQYETKTDVSENTSNSGKSAEQTAAETQESERIAAETQEAERAAAEKAAAEKEAERIAAEKKTAADKIAVQKKEAERIAAEKKAALEKTQQKANFEKDLRTRFDDVFRIDSPSLQHYIPSMYKRFASKTEWTQLYCMLRAVDVLTLKQTDSLATLIDGNLSNGELSDNPKFYMPIDTFSIYTELKSPYGSYFAKLFIHLDGEDWDAFNKRCKRANTLLFGVN